MYMGARRQHQNSDDCGLLKIELRTFGRAADTLNCGAISPVLLWLCFLFFIFETKFQSVV